MGVVRKPRKLRPLVVSTRPQVFSYGGGKQSVAICVLIAQGRLPKPDFIVMADTGYEATATWDYLDRVVQPLLKPLGLQVEIASHDLATVDMYGTKGDLLIPAYTNLLGTSSKLPTFCSNEWKQRVVMRYLRSRGVKECDLWLGFSRDEIERASPSGIKWLHRVYPLIDGMMEPYVVWGRGSKLRLTRDNCIKLVAEAGLPPAPKSSCYMCPHRRDGQWRDLRDNYPDDFARAIELERGMRELDPNVYLHESLIPLDMAKIDKDQEDEMPGCDSGMCMI